VSDENEKPEKMKRIRLLLTNKQYEEAKLPRRSSMIGDSTPLETNIEVIPLFISLVGPLSS
jgi:hypothetical protein